jgi:hypothetical protein
MECKFRSQFLWRLILHIFLTMIVFYMFMTGQNWLYKLTKLLTAPDHHWTAYALGNILRDGDKYDAFSNRR